MPRASLACLLVAALTLLLPAWGAAQEVIQRCESKDGRVTYSNGACPAGTVASRKVNTEPPVSVDDRKAAQERGRREAAAVRQLGKDEAEQAARERKQVDDRAKADARDKARCDDARRALEQARAARTALNAQPAKVDRLQKAELEITRREGDAERACGR